jgi:hypothetical protein
LQKSLEIPQLALLLQIPWRYVIGLKHERYVASFWPRHIPTTKRLPSLFLVGFLGMGVFCPSLAVYLFIFGFGQCGRCFCFSSLQKKFVAMYSVHARGKETKSKLNY